MGNGRRAIVAALVAAVGATFGVPGVGHAYLRQWRRAVAWFVFALGTAVALTFVFMDPATIASMDPGSVTAADLPTEVLVPYYVLLTLSILDAYVTARRLAVERQRRELADAGSCPHCGRDRDPSLEFCWYCSEPLGEVEAAEEDSTLADVRSSRLLD